MWLFLVSWDVQKCLSAGDALVGLGVETLERGQKRVYYRRKRYHLKLYLMFVSLEIVSNVYMSSNLN